jgi:UDP-N-acetylglucosamine diphosphorylase/glucosamine-1-phosphate N-acetyltransferase
MTALFLLEPETPGSAWAPFADSTPISSLRAGAWTIAERWERALGAKSAGVRSNHLAGSVAPNGMTPLVDQQAMVGPAWVADATFCPKLPTRSVGGAKRLLHNGKAVAWRLDPGESWSGRHNDGDGLVIEGLKLRGAFDLVTALEQFLFADTLVGLEAGSDSTPEDVTIIGNPGAIAVRGAEVEPGVVFDVTRGAVILETGVKVLSGSRIEGPTWLGEGTIVNGGRLRQISAGPQCRLHGELSTTVFAGFANKSHDGFVGHSVIGAWANLGAGTITSNLKNTYGPIRLDIGASRIETGRTNLGALIGDHVKTAIGSLLPTGAVIGVGANLFGDPRAGKYTAPFSWGDDGELLDVERFIAVAKRVMPRRDVAVDATVEQALRGMYERLKANS